MKNKVLAWDLGTSGTKTAVYDEEGICFGSVVTPYPTVYLQSNRHEQRPEDWWDSVRRGSYRVLHEHGIEKEEIACCCISGHSMGVVPVGGEGHALLDAVMIWSDSRAEEQARAFFDRFDEQAWYRRTGSGFRPCHYPLFKIKWMQQHMPEVYRDAVCFLGTKDYINYKLTGIRCTDQSYASGSGMWDMQEHTYTDDLIECIGIAREKLPVVRRSTDVIGTILPEVAREMGLCANTAVVCGGVDDACMALGAMAYQQGQSYVSLGSASWIAVAVEKPLLDDFARIYTFEHVVPQRYVSGLSIASGGSALQWVRNNLCRDLGEQEGAYARMDEEAAQSAPGARHVLFDPSLAGGMPFDKDDAAQGGFLGLNMTHTRSDLLRAVLEGVAMDLKRCMNFLEASVKSGRNMYFVGGGAVSDLWMQILAEILNVRAVRLGAGRHAASLGAAACGAVACGLWSGFDELQKRNIDMRVFEPDDAGVLFYRGWFQNFCRVKRVLSTLMRE